MHEIINIDELVRVIGSDNEANGWHEDWNLKEKLLMVHTEVSEAVEELRTDKPDFYLSKTEFVVDESLCEIPKPEGFSVEIADTIIRLLDICYKEQIDISYMINIKLHYNRLRGYRHGGKLI